MGLPAAGATGQILTYSTGTAVFLRWKGERRVSVDGYNIYRRSDGGAWARVNAEPLRRARSLAELRRVAGPLASSVTGIMGIAASTDEITNDMYAKFFADATAQTVLDVLCATAPRVAQAMGELYGDSSFAPGHSAEYRISVIENGAERDVATTDVITPGVRDAIGAIGSLRADSHAGSVVLRWSKNARGAMLGNAVAVNVYRSRSILGPFERVNGAPLVSSSVVTAKNSADATDAWVDDLVHDDSDYYYFLRAVNAFGFEGAPSITVKATPGGPLPGPALLTARIVGGSVQLQWSPPDHRSPAAYAIYRAGDRSEQFERLYAGIPGMKPATQWIDLTATAGQSYYYAVRSISAEGKEEGASDTVGIAVPRTARTPAPLGLQAKPARGRITLTWDKVTDDRLEGYVVQRTNTPDHPQWVTLNGTPLTGRVYVDTVGDARDTYGYTVYAVDHAGNKSHVSAMVTARVPDVIAPESPALANLSCAAGSLTLQWHPPADHDVALYRVYRGNSASALKIVKETPDTSCALEVTGTGPVYITVGAVDSSGNESAAGRAYLVECEEPAPAPPSAVTVAKADAGLRLQWRRSSSKNTAGYVISKLDTRTNRMIRIASVDAAVNEYADVYADSGHEATYAIQARDQSWRTGEETRATFTP